MKYKKQLLEFNLPEIVYAFETRFGDWIWQTTNNYTPNRFDVKDIFKIFNKYIFEDKLDVNIPILLKPENEMQNALAAFAFGKRYNESIEILVLKQSTKNNFFITACAIAHEMIHMYDYFFGPLSSIMQHCYSIEIDNVVNNGHPLQFVRPSSFNFPIYNLHGDFFMSYAKKINEYGFDITDVFDDRKEHQMKRIDIKLFENNELINYLDNIYTKIKTQDHKGFNFIDTHNWFFEIS